MGSNTWGSEGNNGLEKMERMGREGGRAGGREGGREGGSIDCLPQAQLFTSLSALPPSLPPSLPPVLPPPELIPLGHAEGVVAGGEERRAFGQGRHLWQAGGLGR